MTQDMIQILSACLSLNITNNYYNKGGDTVVNQKSDNRVASNKNTGIVMGGPGGGVTGGWLPNGA